MASIGPSLAVIHDILKEQEARENEKGRVCSRQCGVNLSGLAESGGVTTCNYLFTQPLVQTSSKAN